MTETVYTDASDRRQDERMTDGEFRVVREIPWPHRGLAHQTPGRQLPYRAPLGTGQIPDPGWVRLELKHLEHETGAFIGACVEKLLDLSDRSVMVSRNDAEYHAANPEIPWPASWRRAVAARIALELPALRISYASDAADTGTRGAA